ncbi:extracellular solute-binding protein [Marinicrinis lubricantis]|uniref:Extracellular solute-binding protein n=1 Tax=Marinicrinis lubricantis TaxID=2086470 RepID=A0ABW1IJJ8_9BACL
MTKATGKKMLMLLLTAVLLFTIAAGCGNGNGNGGSNESNTEGSDSTNNSQGSNQEEKEPFELTIMANLHTPDVPSDKIEKILEERTNTELTFQWVPDGSYEEKLNAAFATGSLPQAVYMKNQTTFAQFKDAMRDDQFWEVGPYLQDYEFLKNLNPDVLRNTMVDGKVYSLYQERPLSRQGVIWRKDWADKLGITQPPQTPDDLYQMMKKFKEEDPDGNGLDDTIGLADRSDLVYGAFKTVSSYFDTPNGWGELDGQLLPEFMHPGYMDTLDFFKKLYDEGLINQDFPVTSKTDQQDMIYTGKAGMYIGSIGDVLSLRDKTIEINPDAQFDVENRILGPDGQPGIWAIPGYGNMVMFPKSAVETEDELKQILSFFNELMRPENANLIKWGVEGEHYEVVDGKAKASEDSAKKEREVKPFEALAIGGESTIDMLGGHFPYEIKAKAEAKIIEANDFLIHDPTAPLDSPTYNERGARLQELIIDATYQYILGAIDEEGFNKAVDNWKDGGGDKIIEEYNAAYNASK